MYNEKYLYFAKGATRNQDFTASTTTTTYRLTTDLVDPLPDGVAGNDVFANGNMTLELDGSDYTNITFGTHYNVGSDRSKPGDGSVVVVHPNALSYDGTQDITVTTAANDPVFGVTLSSTVGENDAVVRLNGPVKAGDACVWPASSFLGLVQVDNDTADIYFEPNTNDNVGGGVDIVRLSYTAGNFKVLAQSLHDVMMDQRNQGQMIVVADTFRDIFLDNNAPGITAVASITLDS